MTIPKHIQFIVEMLVAFSCGILVGILLHDRLGAWAGLAGLATFIAVRNITETLFSTGDE